MASVPTDFALSLHFYDFNAFYPFYSHIYYVMVPLILRRDIIIVYVCVSSSLHSFLFSFTEVSLLIHSFFTTAHSESVSDNLSITICTTNTDIIDVIVSR